MKDGFDEFKFRTLADSLRDLLLCSITALTRLKFPCSDGIYLSYIPYSISINEVEFFSVVY